MKQSAPMNSIMVQIVYNFMFLQGINPSIQKSNSQYGFVCRIDWCIIKHQICIRQRSVHSWAREIQLPCHYEGETKQDWNAYPRHAIFENQSTYFFMDVVLLCCSMFDSMLIYEIDIGRYTPLMRSRKPQIFCQVVLVSSKMLTVRRSSMLMPKCLFNYCYPWQR